jgi:hypothetical protein
MFCSLYSLSVIFYVTCHLTTAYFKFLLGLSLRCAGAAVDAATHTGQIGAGKPQTGLSQPAQQTGKMLARIIEKAASSGIFPYF